ncbi:putative glycolipid-binding domain-containing protein [Planosporangium thailandense]|uniref:putative glycolipid-binding domain-containing protein n=1 Tax=Planosporangium thailandense TaxID=765197 RepID=UPI00197BB6D2|nr:putative glycolipid-binding domain-containing protein [Planosporangium thailandense]
MTVLPRTLLWQRTDVHGAEHVVFDDRRGLTARGVALAAGPVPYECRYELDTSPGWLTTRFDAVAEGGGWQRKLHMERVDGRWRVTASELGDLTAAGQPNALQPGAEDPDLLVDVLDIDLQNSPLTNTLPLRRLGLITGTVEIVAAWVLLPSLTVIANAQTYTALGPGRVRYASGSFTADLELDEDGYVVRYPGLATR